MEIKRSGLHAGASSPRTQAEPSQDQPLLLAPLPHLPPAGRSGDHALWQQTEGASLAAYDGKVGRGDPEVPAGVRPLFGSHSPC